MVTARHLERVEEAVPLHAYFDHVVYVESTRRPHRKNLVVDGDPVRRNDGNPRFFLVVLFQRLGCRLGDCPIVDEPVVAEHALGGDAAERWMIDPNAGLRVIANRV